MSNIRSSLPQLRAAAAVSICLGAANLGCSSGASGPDSASTSGEAGPSSQTGAAQTASGTMQGSAGVADTSPSASAGPSDSAGEANGAPSAGQAQNATAGTANAATSAGARAAAGGSVGPAGAGASAGEGSAPTSAQAGDSAPPGPGAQVQCAATKPTTTEARLHMHHIHFNTQDPDAAIAFVEKYFDAKPVDYCKDDSGTAATRAAKTERAYFLYSKVATPPSNMRLNRLAHVGYINSDVAGELKRLNDLDVPLADASVCATAAMGTPCNTFNVQWFYVDTPESARFEIATGPGPAPSGFGHIHLVAPDYSFFQKVLGDALQDPNGNPHVDMVNMVASGRTGVLDETITYEDTRGAAVDHVGFSTGDLEGTLARIEAAGIKIEEPISLKPEFGFRSFMVRSTEGIWLEILEGDAFTP